MITKDGARRRVLQDWQSLAAANAKPKPDGMDGLMFFADVHRNNPRVLEFRDRGDKWQTVHAWLLHARLVSD